MDRNKGMRRVAPYVSIVALPTEGVDRNFGGDVQGIRRAWSPSPRRAWIEIFGFWKESRSEIVALPTEGVDRNFNWLQLTYNQLVVALPTEGVDRNFSSFGALPASLMSPSPRRAWIEIPRGMVNFKTAASPSPRRAWIEIILPDGGRDCSGSPSPRRAWIEIGYDSVTVNVRGKSPSPRRAWIEILV